MLGFHLRRRLGDRLGLLDGVGGALLVGCLGLFLFWVGGAVALNTPGASELREPIQRSKILGELNAVLPPSGPLIQALARFDPFPEIDGPQADVPPPNSRIARDPQVRRAADSVVKVLGTACGLGVQGSGWIAGDGVVVTNAHVVAGQDDTTVQLEGEGEHIDARRSGSTRATTSRSCARPASAMRGRCGSTRTGARATPRRSSASPRTAPTTCGPAGSATPRRS